ncbi:MAG: glycoside hydrolase family 3 C-terminal domain-containing protein [Dysgonamonadaceae bacterium]|jgi:beta-glucosidase|nr:glycoside hydrolase family 3 C-terminal domain-containing protein [Dysgonamonadaceae bacterium]
MKTLQLFFLLIAFPMLMSGQVLPYKNPALSSEERAKDLLSRLTLDEKAILMCDVSDAIPRLGIKKFDWWSEALHGYANQMGTTVFPQPIGMAASFNEELVYRVFDAVSDEARARVNEEKQAGKESVRFHGLSVWTPNINIFRDPRWGRGQETYGEDPFLMSKMGIAVVNGLQGPRDAKYRKLLACAKHFAVHSGPEWSRHTLNLNDVGKRDLYETYLPAFKALVQEADVRQVMCAYQRLDDEPCCGNTRLMQRILRNDWGFRHVVVSDCGAIADFYYNHKTSSDPTHAAAEGVIAGTDVECGFGYAYLKVPEAVKRGLLLESDVDNSVLRLLTERFELGDFDDDSLVPWTKISPSVINSPENQKLALEMARQTMTLLQNRKDILPLAKNKKIAVIGPNADDKRMMWGNYNATPAHTVTIADGIREKLGADRVLYDRGCDITDDKMTVNYFSKASKDGKTGVKAAFWNNIKMEGNPVATEYYQDAFQKTTMGQYTFAEGVSMLDFSAKYETVYHADASEEIVFRIESTGDCLLFINGEKVYDADGRSQNARVPLKTEKGKDYAIELQYVAPNWGGNANLSFTFGREVPVNFDNLITRLKGIETVIFVGGISSRLEGEEMPVEIPGFKGGDRTDIQLPAVQRQCIKALKTAGKKVILINCSGSAVGLAPETETCEAILQAWYAGEQGGTAVADAIFGDYNPAGKLPLTFYKDTVGMRDFEDYSMQGRTYRYLETAPLFPFGFGLSYTKFTIGEAKLSKNAIKSGETVSLSVPVANVGKRDGAEVVQVYIRKLGDKDAPLKSLKAYKRIDLKKGEKQNIAIDLNASAFEFFDSDFNEMRVAAGDYEILYGNSSDDKDLKKINIKIG